MYACFSYFVALKNLERAGKTSLRSPANAQSPRGHLTARDCLGTRVRTSPLTSMLCCVCVDSKTVRQPHPRARSPAKLYAGACGLDLEHTGSLVVSSLEDRCVL